MRISKQARRDAKHLFRTCQVDGLLSEDRVRQVVNRVLETQPRGYLATLHYFQRLVKLDVERRTARIESAQELPEGLRNEVQTKLSQRYGPGLRIEVATQPELVGGMRIRVGSDVLDGSIDGRLQTLEESF
jgi:F-type H+-transporting ATPase subunit delta